MTLTADELYRAIGNTSAADDIVAIIDESGATYGIIEVVREPHEDVPGKATLWLKVSAN